MAASHTAAPHADENMLRHRTRSSGSLVDSEREDDDRLTKRARDADPVRHFVVAFDEPYRYIEVSLATLRDYNCRTARVIERDVPVARTTDGQPVWRVPYSHAAVKCWVRAMTFGEIDLGTEATMSEVFSLLKYEGIETPANMLTMFHQQEAARRIQTGLWSSGDESLQVSVRSTVESVADALVRWPRLCAGLKEVAAGSTRPAFTCSATRVWVRFAPRPQLRYQYDGKRDSLYEYCAQKPRPPAWLMRTLRLLGKIHCSLPQRARTVQCFNEMDALVQQRIKTFFTQEQQHSSPECQAEVRKFMHDVVATTHTAGPRVGRHAGSNMRETNEELLFARACISLAEWVVENTHALKNFFSGSCADDKGDTVERAVLARALKARRVRVVRWIDSAHEGVLPLVFPPLFAEDAGEGLDGPSVLLSFEQHF